VSISDALPSEFVNSPAVPAWVSQCDWDVMTTDQMGLRFIHDSTLEVRPGSTEITPDQIWSVVYCGTGVDTEGALPTGITVAWPFDTEPPQIVLDWLVAYAYALVEVPVQTGQSAPIGDENAPLITQLPTWLWIEPTIWTPRSATTPPVFGITATVTVTPANITFTGPDNETIDCGPNLGPAYNFNRAEEDQHSDCTLTYHHSSAVGEWTLASTLTWEVTYTCSEYCGPGTLAPLTVTNTRSVRVAELQAVLTTPTPAREAP
jgi:hypothetical protein